jgi:hypothetical protein
LFSFATAAVSGSVLLAEGPSSQKLTRLMWFPKASPWIVASSSSRALGWRDPSAPLEEVNWVEQVFRRLAYSERSGTPWRTPTDFGKVGELSESLGISKRNVDN